MVINVTLPEFNLHSLVGWLVGSFVGWIRDHNAYMLIIL